MNTQNLHGHSPGESCPPARTITLQYIYGHIIVGSYS